jgi:hypothetical protein
MSCPPPASLNETIRSSTKQAFRMKSPTFRLENDLVCVDSWNNLERKAALAAAGNALPLIPARSNVVGHLGCIDLRA